MRSARTNWKQRAVVFIFSFFFSFSVCFLGTRVTALLKNASKQLQDSRDWMWAHKVVTVIQTSAAWTEGSRRLQRRLWNAAAVPLNNTSVAESQSSLTQSCHVAQRLCCCGQKQLVCGDVFFYFTSFLHLMPPERKWTDCCVTHARRLSQLRLWEQLPRQPSARHHCKMGKKFTIKDPLAC